MGFGIRRFVKILGLECALYDRPLPLELWYSTSRHRDVLAAVVPREFQSSVSLDVALKCFKLEHYAPLGPHTNPEMELAAALELTTKLGFLTHKTALAGGEGENGKDESEG